MVLKKDFSFPCGHRLHLHPGGCRNIHGHNYHGTITIEFKDGCSRYIEEKAGYYIDFSDIKELLNGWYDHRFLMYQNDPIRASLGDREMGIAFPGIRLVTFMPTAENMAQEMCDLIKGKLEEQELAVENPDKMFGGNIIVELWETDTSYVSRRIPWHIRRQRKI